MRALLIDDEARAKVKKVMDYAARPENRFHVYPDGRASDPPGRNYRHCTMLSTYRCVFSHTEDHKTKRVFRQLSISIPSTKMPNIIAAFTIAELFGFTGWDGKSFDLPREWLIEIHKQDNCIVLGQELKTEGNNGGPQANSGT